MVQVNLAKGLDRSYENKSLAEILAAPPSALAGLTREPHAVLKESFRIDTVGERGSNTYFALAGVLVRSRTRKADQPHTPRQPRGPFPTGAALLARCCGVRLVRPAGGSPTRRTRG